MSPSAIRNIFIGVVGALVGWSVPKAYLLIEKNTALRGELRGAASASAAPFMAAPIVYPPFDFEKNRQIRWCLTQGGVPTMTFDRDGSNVLCLQSSAVIEFPEGEP